MSEKPAANTNPAIPPEMVGNEYYDLVMGQDEQPDPAQLTAGQETEPNGRLARLFAPRLTSDEARLARPQSEETDETEQYRRLIMGEVTDEELSTMRRAAAKREREESQRFVKEPTMDMKYRAFQTLQAAKEDDPMVEAIVDKHVPKPAGIPDYVAIVDQVRLDPALRYELGSYLLRDKLQRFKTESPHSVPYRVFVETEKQPSHPGYLQYGKLSSGEYSAMLALSMLDGTFDKSKTTSDEIRVDQGRPENTQGQHRLGAQLLLGQLPNNCQA